MLAKAWVAVAAALKVAQRKNSRRVGRRAASTTEGAAGIEGFMERGYYGLGKSPGQERATSAPLVVAHGDRRS